MRKSTSIFIILLFMSKYSFGASGDWVKDMFGSPLFWLGLGVFIILSFTFFVLRHAFRVMKEVTLKAQGRWEEVQEKESESNLMRTLTAAVPVEEEEDILTDHNYDGIQELDNRLPPWWLWGFYISIVFAVVYMIRFHVTGDGMSSHEELQAEYAEWEAEQEAKLQSGAIVKLDPATLEPLTDEASLAYGEQVLNGVCSSCHNPGGAGSSSAPNLTDEYWLHGGSLENVFTTIKEGVPGTAMAPWGKSFTDEKIHKIASYVLSLQGSNPPNAKEPEGELWVAPETPESTEETADSTSTSE